MPMTTRLDERDEFDRLEVAEALARFSDRFVGVSDDELDRELAKAQAEVRAEMRAKQVPKPQPSIDFGYPIEGSGNIPTFDDIDDEADFWDTHEVTADGAGGWTARHIDPAELVDHVVIRLDPKDRQTLIELAREQGIAPSALATAWLEDRLRMELERKAS